MASQLECLKTAQAQQMAAAAAPLCQPGGPAGGLEAELAHELTPSMMAELMPSGFSAGSSHHSGGDADGGSGAALYEMSQLSGGSGGGAAGER